jgi:hypothetical protein
MHANNRQVNRHRQTQIALLRKINTIMREELDSPDLIIRGAELRARLTPRELSLARSRRLLFEEAPDIFAFNRLMVFTFAMELFGREAFLAQQGGLDRPMRSVAKGRIQKNSNGMVS